MSSEADPQVAIGVVDAVVAGGRRTQCEVNIRARARRLGLTLAETIILDEDEPDALARLVAVRDRYGATVAIAPSLRHLRDTERHITAWADLHTLGPRRTYRRGYRW